MGGDGESLNVNEVAVVILRWHVAHHNRTYRMHNSCRRGTATKAFSTIHIIYIYIYTSLPRQYRPTTIIRGGKILGKNTRILGNNLL